MDSKMMAFSDRARTVVDVTAITTARIIPEEIILVLGAGEHRQFVELFYDDPKVKEEEYMLLRLVLSPPGEETSTEREEIDRDDPVAGQANAEAAAEELP